MKTMAIFGKDKGFFTRLKPNLGYHLLIISALCLLSFSQVQGQTDKLSRIDLSGGEELTPAFHPDITDYNVRVANSVSSITVSATKSGEGTIHGTGTYPLEVGDNRIFISVVAGNQTRVYTITVRRLNNDANLSKLEVSAGTLLPPFSPYITEYTVNVGSLVPNVTVTASAKDANSTKVEGTGRYPLSTGRNAL
ncbi:MAG: cadherin-like beta sandwich domain-containing protein, partial [Dysgonamonadaceae bacterium]|nr:cadherin-like beta sandwich domain-containing protein [Dysgonamonadaceae bacterium]